MTKMGGSFPRPIRMAAHSISAGIRQHASSLTESGGGVSTVVYDAFGNVVSETDEAGSTTTRTFDTDGNVLSETNPAGGRIQFTYGAGEQVLTSRTAQGELTQYDYDSAGRLTRIVEPDGSETAYVYDSRGNLIRRITDRSGPVIRLRQPRSCVERDRCQRLCYPVRVQLLRRQSQEDRADRRRNLVWLRRKWPADLAGRTPTRWITGRCQPGVGQERSGCARHGRGG